MCHHGSMAGATTPTLCGMPYQASLFAMFCNLVSGLFLPSSISKQERQEHHGGSSPGPASPAARGGGNASLEGLAPLLMRGTGVAASGLVADNPG
mmetsp:Transcript_12748/g.28164  ORF Transcript_12748/g.28164 Transcript_12748/m.28164 type:complete len:95 (+) Transcript_12748:97-381(+)